MVKFVTERLTMATTLTVDDDDDVPLVRTISYFKLPNHLRLSVLKLDGSRFDVHVSKNATLIEVKQAIEEVFTLSPSEGEGNISWTQVWGHFCLCYEGQKLVNDKARIRDVGIRDGDQLQFIRHMSINYLHSKRRAKNQSVASPEHSMSSAGSNVREEIKYDGLANKDNLEVQEDNYRYYGYEDHQEELPVPEFKLVPFLRGWFSYAKMKGVTRKASVGKSGPTRFGLHCLGGGPARMVV